MDWTSPTTKKHIQEAEARACELLGVGRNRAYRIYKLPCGHEQMLTTRMVRIGVFECKACLSEKLGQEAETQGCKLLGPGRSSVYRLYALPCGHKQEVQTGDMRRGVFRCHSCINEKHIQQAEAHGCKLLGAGRNKAYRLYQLSCGHEQEVEPGKMRTGAFACIACLDKKLTLEAEAQACKLLGAGGIASNRLYGLPCGHKQEVQPGNMRDGSFRCQTCLGEKLKQQAATHGCKLLGAGRNKAYRLYQLSCGHEQEVVTSNMRLGNFLCQICEETSRTMPSNVYLLLIKVDADQWLKLGYAKGVGSRTLRYGLPQGAQVTTIERLAFETGNEAHAVEADIHKRYKRMRLSHSHAKELGMKNGFNECYPITMLETLVAELEASKPSRDRT